MAVKVGHLPAPPPGRFFLYRWVAPPLATIRYPLGRGLLVGPYPICSSRRPSRGWSCSIVS